MRGPVRPIRRARARTRPRPARPGVPRAGSYVPAREPRTAAPAPEVRRDRSARFGEPELAPAPGQPDRASRAQAATYQRESWGQRRRRPRTGPPGPASPSSHPPPAGSTGRRARGQLRTSVRARQPRTAPPRHRAGRLAATAEQPRRSSTTRGVGLRPGALRRRVTRLPVGRAPTRADEPRVGRRRRPGGPPHSLASGLPSRRRSRMTRTAASASSTVTVNVWPSARRRITPSPRRTTTAVPFSGRQR